MRVPRMVRPRAQSRLLKDPQFMRDVERLLSERREVQEVSGAQLDVDAQVTGSDVDAAIAMWDAANSGTDAVGLLRAKLYEGPWDT